MTENIDRLLKRLNDGDDEVRQHLRDDPVKVMHEHGIPLNPDQQDKIRAQNLSATTDAQFVALDQAGIRRWL